MPPKNHIQNANIIGSIHKHKQNKNITQTTLQQNTIKTQAIQAQHKQNTNKTHAKPKLHTQSISKTQERQKQNTSNALAKQHHQLTSKRIAKHWQNNTRKQSGLPEKHFITYANTPLEALPRLQC